MNRAAYLTGAVPSGPGQAVLSQDDDDESPALHVQKLYGLPTSSRSLAWPG